MAKFVTSMQRFISGTTIYFGNGPNMPLSKTSRNIFTELDKHGILLSDKGFEFWYTVPQNIRNYLLCSGFDIFIVDLPKTAVTELHDNLLLDTNEILIQKKVSFMTDKYLLSQIFPLTKINEKDIHNNAQSQLAYFGGLIANQELHMLGRNEINKYNIELMRTLKTFEIYYDMPPYIYPEISDNSMYNSVQPFVQLVTRLDN